MKYLILIILFAFVSCAEEQKQTPVVMPDKPQELEALYEAHKGEELFKRSMWYKEKYGEPKIGSTHGMINGDINEPYFFDSTLEAEYWKYAISKGDTVSLKTKVDNNIRELEAYYDFRDSLKQDSISRSK